MQNGGHPKPETLAAFVDGRLDGAARLELLAHLDGCPSCVHNVAAANETFADEPVAAPPRATASHRWWWLAAAAVLAAAVFLVPRLITGSRSPVAQLAALLPDDARPVEPRLSGGFAYAPYRGPMRGDDASARQLIGKAGQLDAAAQKDPSAAAQHAAGVALVLIGAPDEAIARLTAATEKDPGDPKAWNDLAAARYAEALRSARPSLYPHALAAADRALQLDPKLAEARFNRALILERTGVLQEARAEWERYLALDGTSPWAAEARQRLARLPRQTAETQFKQELPQLERAVRARDADATRAFVDRYRQQSRAWGEGEWLGMWGESGSEEALSLARAAGEVLGGLLRDAVAAIDTATPERRALLANAHVTYRKGRIAYSRGKLAEAEAHLREAARAFAAGYSPMALMARYYAACARFDQHDRPGAVRELEALLPERHYPTLAAHLRWELGLARMTDGDWTGALPLLSDSAAAFRALGERSNMAFVETLLADTLAPLGRPDESWAARIRSLEVQSTEGRGTRLAISLGAAARMELTLGHRDSARALLALERQATVATRDDSLLADVLVREAVLASKVGGGDAAAALREAEKVARRVGDPDLRARALADVDFAAGAVALRDDPRGAAQRLSRAIEVYRTRELPFYLPEALLLRARASREGAARDLEDGIAELERNRGAFTGTGVLDAGNALYEDAIALSLDGHDVPRAFAYIERARGAEGVTLAELQQRLRGSSTAVLEVVTLPREVVSLVVTEDDVAVTRHPVERTAVASMNERKLYDALLRPAESLLARATLLIVVADRTFAGVPFAALHDGQRFLVERIAVASAASASALRAGRAARAPRTLLAVVLPAGGERRLVALPQSAAEVNDIRGLYARATVMQRATFGAFADAARAGDVVHVAGHTERTGGIGNAALAFDDRLVSWSTIAETRLPRSPVVVLAACETLRLPPRSDARALSLGGAFAAAGAADVIGTLTPIPDSDARTLFGEIHRQLAAGADPADAVHRVQRNEAAREAAGQRSAWRAIALLTTRIPEGRPR